MEKKILTKGTDKKICGVCSGIAEYFNCDPTIVRLTTTLLALCGGGGLILYIVGAIIMPESEN